MSPDLSKREIEVMQMISDGLSNQQIAKVLSLSKRTIDTQRQTILLKLGASNSAHAVKIAITQNLIK